jgi:hypothetical protein
LGTLVSVASFGKSAQSIHTQKMFLSLIHVFLIKYKSFYPAMTAFTDQYSLPNIFFDIGQL